ncbi:MAG: RNA polymerase sigma factor [Bacteroidales bacterium]|nr:RNA polymerase sigma factor [Bacteroidales bacterium]
MTEQAFHNLLAREHGRLVALAAGFLRTSGMDGDAEDIVQEAEVKLWELSQKGYPIRDASALVVRLTKNLCVERWRVKRRIVFQPLAGDNYEGGTTAESAVDEQDNARLRDMLYSRLSETQRRLLTLRNDYELSLDEIALATGKPKGSVKATISQARKQLLEEIKKIR